MIMILLNTYLLFNYKCRPVKKNSRYNIIKSISKIITNFSVFIFKKFCILYSGYVIFHNFSKPSNISYIKNPEINITAVRNAIKNIRE